MCVFQAVGRRLAHNHGINIANQSLSRQFKRAQTANFLINRCQQADLAMFGQTGFLQLNQGVDHCCQAAFHIDAAAAIDSIINYLTAERIMLPFV